MKDVKDLGTLEKRIFEPDTIPFIRLATASGLQSFTAPFNFKNIEIGEDEDKNVIQIRMSTGEYKLDDNFYSIRQIIIDARSIAFNICADSSISNKLFIEIMELLAVLDPKFKKNKPVLSSIQTQCVVTLDLDVMDFFSDNMKAFLINATDNITKKNTDIVDSVTIQPKIIRFEVSFKLKQNLIEKSLAISDKSLVIEPRFGTTTNQRIYYTLSPNDTDTHLNLLRQFEKSFS
jgi:hypothetical protein